MDTNKQTYKYRGLPCSIAPDEDLWCVSGQDTNPNSCGGGVLEWCYGKEDAQARLLRMQQFPQFKNLKAAPYLQPEFRWRAKDYLRTRNDKFYGHVVDTHDGQYGHRYQLRNAQGDRQWFFESELTDTTKDGFALLSGYDSGPNPLDYLGHLGGYDNQNDV